MFELDPRLQADGPILDAVTANHTIIIKQGMGYPWLIVVPEVAGAVEIFDLDEAQANQLMAVVAKVGKVLKSYTGAKKINVECIGNVCSQLHVHIIARHEDDETWPAPVWSAPFDGTTRIALDQSWQDGLTARLRMVFN